MSGIQRNTERLDALELKVDGFKRIQDLPNRATADGTEKLPVDVVGTEYQMLATTFFKNKYQTKEADFDVELIHCDSYIKVLGDNLTVTIPNGLGWNLGSKLTLLIQGTGFAFDLGGSVNLLVPTALQDIENSIITLIKTDANEYQVSQTGAAGGGGGAVDSVNTQTGVVVLDADDIDDTSTTNKWATAAQLALADGSVQSVQAGTNITIDNTDPNNPIVNAIETNIDGGSASTSYLSNQNINGGNA